MQKQIPVLALAGLGIIAIAGLVLLGFTPGETESIRTSLSTVAIAAVAAIAGLVRGAPPGE